MIESHPLCDFERGVKVVRFAHNAHQLHEVLLWIATLWRSVVKGIYGKKSLKMRNRLLTSMLRYCCSPETGLGLR